MELARDGPDRSRRRARRCQPGRIAAHAAVVVLTRGAERSRASLTSVNAKAFLLDDRFQDAPPVGPAWRPHRPRAAELLFCGLLERGGPDAPASSGRGSGKAGMCAGALDPVGKLAVVTGVGADHQGEVAVVAVLCEGGTVAGQ